LAVRVGEGRLEVQDGRVCAFTCNAGRLDVCRKAKVPGTDGRADDRPIYTITVAVEKRWRCWPCSLT
jgi:hypothetical protein